MNDPGAQRTVLVIEDEASLQELAVEILEEQGHRVLRAASAAEARTVFASSLHSIDLVISDMNLPDGRGTVVLAELASQQPGLRVVFMSGFDEEGSDCLDGAHFLRKPFSLTELADAVALALKGA